MLFDICVKTDEKDFYNYEEELNQLLTLTHQKIKPRLIALLGPRRVGKTSMLNIFSKKYGKAAIIDGRKCYNQQEFAIQLKLAISAIFDELGGRALIEKTLCSLDEISLSMYGAKGVWKQDSKDILKQLDNALKQMNEHAILCIDEAQLIEWKHFSLWLSHVYDYYPRITLLLSGSQIGLVEQMLSKTPLKGRIVHKVFMNQLPKEKAIGFLVQGFAQQNKRIDLVDVEDAVHKFGGLIGWLTYYGYFRLTRTHDESIDEVIRVGTSIVKEELLSFINTYKGDPKNVVAVLKAISIGLDEWNEIKRYVGNLSDGSLSRLLKKLKLYTFIEEHDGKYRVVDPMLSIVINNSALII